MDILIFNWHEPYISMLARTGHDFHLSTPQERLHWNAACRPLPDNAQEHDWPPTPDGIDLAVAFTLQDLQLMQAWTIPKLFIALNMVSTDTGKTGQEKDDYLRHIQPLFEGVRVAFVSEKKHRDWGWDGPVVLPGINLLQPELHLNGYTGRIPSILRVGNNLRTRGAMQGWPIQEAACKGLPSRIVGTDPLLLHSKPAVSWDELCTLYRDYRCALFTLNDEMEDGYNLAMLEAMATGMPIVTTPNSSSPILGGHNGLVAETPDQLFQCLRTLLDDLDMARTLGKAARQTVEQQFPWDRCIDQWNAVFEDCLPAEPAIVPDYYTQERPEVQDLIPADGHLIVDLGCGAGALGKAIKSQRGAFVLGIEQDAAAAAQAARVLDDVWVEDLDSPDIFTKPLGPFDGIIAADVLEHLRDPEAVLRRWLEQLRPGGWLVASIPNIRQEGILLDLLCNGRWTYQDSGLLDRTHLRFFTLAEIRDLMQRLGLEVEEVRATTYKPIEAMESLYAAVAALPGDGRLREEATAAQWLIRARKATQDGHRATIIIPVYNQADYTERCLLALAEHTAGEYEVIIVDNGSTDGTAELLARLSGDVQVIHNDTNRGFAVACNQGAAAAEGEWLVFLNNDTEPLAGWLAALLDVDEKAGVTGALLLEEDRHTIQHAGVSINDDGWPTHDDRGWYMESLDLQEDREVPAVTGACLAIRRRVFHQVDGFDEGYKNGCEDVDLCFKVRQAGYQVWFKAGARLIHHEGRTEGRFDYVNDNLRRLACAWPRQVGPRWQLNWHGLTGLQAHSLSIVNAALIEALTETGRVQVGNFPDGIHVRHAWPPDFTRPRNDRARLIVMQPWEYGSLPLAWQDPAQQADQLWAYSRYVQQQWLDAGLPEERVQLVPLGVDPTRFRVGVAPLKLSTQKAFRFLFVGGTLWRKGIDVLLEAYRRTFTAGDDVCLVVKDVGVRTYYHGQTAEKAIEEHRQQAHAPEVLHLTADLPAEQLPSLYAACHCLVHPYRGEGFGLPVAEAMACGLPVIVTQGGACDDFVDEDVGWMIPSTRREIELQEKTIRPAWVLEPDGEALGELLKDVYIEADQRCQRGTAGAQRIAAGLTWADSATAALRALIDLL